MSVSAKQRSNRPVYPAYKPSGVAWLGDVPEHWEVRRLKYTADLINVKVDGADNDLPYTGLEHIESWTGKRIAPNGDTTSEGQAKLYRRGDVLFGKLRPYLAKAHAADSDGICTGELLVLHPKVVQQKFLVDYVLNPDFVAIVDSSTYGAKMPRANWDFIGNLPALIPPGDEQRAIAAFLDRETARIDALIEKKRRQIEVLQEKRSALVSHAVTKGLDPHAPMKDSGIEWLGEIPEHWEVKRIKQLGAIRYGLGEPPEYVGDGLPFIRATDIKRGKIDLNAVRKVRREDVPWSRRPTLQLGEILVVRSGAYTGDSAIVTKDVAGSIAGYDMVLTVTKAHSPFVAWVLLSRYMLEGQIYLERMRAAQPHLNAEELGGFVILMPPIDEQRQITDALKCETSKLDAMADRIGDSIIMLRDLRTALISAAVSGKIDVRKEII